MALDISSLLIEPLQRGQIFFTTELRALDRRLQHLNRLIVDPKREAYGMHIARFVEQLKTLRPS